MQWHRIIPPKLVEPIEVIRNRLASQRLLHWVFRFRKQTDSHVVALTQSLVEILAKKLVPDSPLLLLSPLNPTQVQIVYAKARPPLPSSGRHSNSLAEAENRVRQALKTLNDTQVRVQDYRQLVRQYSRAVARCNSLCKVRESLIRMLPPLGWVVAVSVTSTGIGTIIGLMSLVSVPWIAALAAVGFVTGLGGSASLFYVPSSKQLHAKLNTAQVLHDKAADEWRTTVEAVPVLQQQHDQANTAYLQLRNTVEQQQQRILHEGRLNQLSAIPWQALSGTDFEEYLGHIFRAHGYQVDLTNTTNDCGVDLVLTRGTRRIAVQAKGYPSGGSIGNDAVLKVVGGMRIYDCNMSAVVTNSRYTRQAKTAAAKSDCYLIDRESIPRMIRGQFPWG